MTRVAAELIRKCLFRVPAESGYSMIQDAITALPAYSRFKHTRLSASSYELFVRPNAGGDCARNTDATGCGFLKAGEFSCKPPRSLDSGDRRKDAPRKIVRSAQTQITKKS